jgi:uncharacterized protein involved in exopolysaccharide biosynthesis
MMEKAPLAPASGPAPTAVPTPDPVSALVPAQSTPAPALAATLTPASAANATPTQATAYDPTGLAQLAVLHPSAVAQAPNPNPSAPAFPDDDEISLIDLVATLWRRKWLIFILTVIAAIGSLVYALLQDNYYQAKATLIPLSTDKGSLLTQYAGLAQLAGFSLPGSGQSSPQQKIVAILKSRSLAERIVEDLNLVPVLIEKPQNVKPPRTPYGLALETFREDIFVVSADDKSSLISVSTELKDPILASTVTNYALKLLERILNEKNFTISKKGRLLLETQIAEQQRKVRDLQQQLTTFQQSSGMLTPQGQVQQSMTLYSTLLAQKIQLEIELSRMENALSADNPKITSLNSQLQAIEAQLRKIESGTSSSVGPSLRDTPETLVQYQNIMTELEVASRIYGALLATLESQKIQESEDQLFVEIIDPATIPEKKSKPSRAMICIVGTMAGGFLGILLAFLMEAWHNAKAAFLAKI